MPTPPQVSRGLTLARGGDGPCESERISRLSVECRDRTRKHKFGSSSRLRVWRTCGWHGFARGIRQFVESLFSAVESSLSETDVRSHFGKILDAQIECQGLP